MRLKLPPIYPITDKLLSGKSTHLEIVRELVRGGATLVQIRDKSTPLHELLSDLRQCAEFTSKRGITLLVNDRCDLVLSCDADGVHLGQEDLPPDAARSVLGRRKVIGYSTHTRAQVRRAADLPLDYLGFGPVFATATKDNPSPVVGISGLRSACRLSSKPVVAIGGIGMEQIPDVLEAGAASAAVISALMKAPDLARRMEQLLKAAQV
jgi:thiamine-phosphate pyrophosphorylase